MSKPEWQKWGELWIRWHLKSPVGRRSRCEGRKHEGDRWVPPDEPRLEVDNDRGKERANSHRKRNQWVCRVCAEQAGVPQVPTFHNQIEMF